ncbi:MAG: OmpH family outer membrane protein [Planctomycetota bacterium]
MSINRASWRTPWFAVSVLALGFASYSAVRAGTPVVVQAAPTAIGIVDLERLIGGLNEVTDQNKENGNRAKVLQGQIDELKKKADAAQAELDVAAKNDPKRLEKRFAVEELMLRLEAARKGFSAVMSIEKGTYAQQLYGRILAAVDALAKTQGLDLILLDDRSLTFPPDAQDLPEQTVNNIIQSKRVLFASASVDVTSQLVTLMNNQHAAAKPKK